jgi:integrase
MHLRGVPTAVISKWLGHATASLTMATYVHSQDDALAAAGAVYATAVMTSQMCEIPVNSRPSEALLN